MFSPILIVDPFFSAFANSVLSLILRRIQTKDLYLVKEVTELDNKVMRTLDQWLGEYASSHQNRANQIVHKICVPLIFFSILGLLWDWQIQGIRLTHIAAFLGMIFYFKLGMKPAVLMMAQLLVCFMILHAWEEQTGSVFVGSVIIFVLAWIGQFVGHKIEGKKPSFFTDLQFLLIGPLWVFSFLFKK